MSSAASIQQQAGQYQYDPIMKMVAAGVDQMPAGLDQYGKPIEKNSGTGEIANMDIIDLINTLRSISDTNNAIAVRNVADSRNWNQQMTQWSMEYNAAEAAKNRDWQEYMSNTAHQREVADLKAAGLNPVLSAMGGNGAAVTSGASASANAPKSDTAGVDESVAMSLVQILGSLLAAETNMRNTDVNARLQEAIADKQRELNKYIAELQSATSLEATRISGEYGVRSAGTSAAGVMGAAQITADANLRMNTLNHIFDLQMENQKYFHNLHLQNDAQSHSEYMAVHYPQSYAGVLSAWDSANTQKLEKWIQELGQIGAYILPAIGHIVDLTRQGSDYLETLNPAQQSALIDRAVSMVKAGYRPE